MTFGDPPTNQRYSCRAREALSSNQIDQSCAVAYVCPSFRPSRARGRIAAVEPPERTRGHHTDEQNAHTHGDDVIAGAQIEASHTSDEKVGDDEVCKSPEHVHGRGRKTFARRLGERALKGPPHHAADEMRNGVCQKSAAEQIGYVVKPIHGQALLSRRSMTMSADFGSRMVTVTAFSFLILWMAMKPSRSFSCVERPQVRSPWNRLRPSA